MFGIRSLTFELSRVRGLAMPAVAGRLERMVRRRRHLAGTRVSIAKTCR
jgi:hypothetical protein